MKKKIVIAAIALASVFAGTVAFESFPGQNEAKAQAYKIVPGINVENVVHCPGVGMWICMVPIEQQ